MKNHLRNICIIAHVDHGKTTLVDHLLRQAGTFQKHETTTERVMDSMDLEREKGITILAKNTSVRLGETKINIVDTPGHADFGGEVERILGMCNGALLLVDAVEGPLPQTRFVLSHALRQGLKVALVINKVDRPECREGNRIQEVINQTFDLFVELNATEEQLDFPIIYACARQGWCTMDIAEVPKLIADHSKATLMPLFDLILKVVPPPPVAEGDGVKLMVSNLTYSDYVGRLGVGRILSGEIKKGTVLYRLGVGPDGSPKTEKFTVTEALGIEGLKQVPVAALEAGEIGIFSGSETLEIGDTVVSDPAQGALPRIVVEKPTLAMIFSINSSPLSGREGEAIQSRKLRERLLREVRNNVALRFEELDTQDSFRILGRGELQFAILIEQMRREGLEFMIGKPTVLLQEENGEKMEPIEMSVLDLPEEHVGDVTSLFQGRKGILQKYEAQGSNRVRLEFEIPTRGLLGLRSKYLTATRGTGLMSARMLGYQPFRGQLLHRLSGALVCDRNGQAVEYALRGLEDRGVMFISPGEEVYEGMIVGQHNLENDLNINPCKEKKLTNIRSAHAEVLVALKGIRNMSLEQFLEWIDEDEWLEITPKSVRPRKKVLSGNLRSVKRSERVGV